MSTDRGVEIFPRRIRPLLPERGTYPAVDRKQCSFWSGRDIQTEEIVSREAAWDRKEEHDSGSFVGRDSQSPVRRSVMTIRLPM